VNVIAIANHKGGCAKTTVCLNVAVTLAATGSKVLAVDLDFQGNLSASLGVDLDDLEDTRRTSHRLMLDERADFSQFVTQARPRLDIIPACLDDDAEALLDGQAVSRELLLRQKLAPAAQAYDYCVVDTPPALRVPTLNALAMADLTIVPIETSIYALHGIAQLMRKVVKVRKAHSPKMIVMALSSIFTIRNNLDKAVRAKVIERFTEDYVFQTTIPRAVAVGEATSTGRAVTESSSDSPATFAYHKLVTEIREVMDDEEGRQETSRRVTK
jgi:chromosome partitioning protein